MLPHKQNGILFNDGRADMINISSIGCGFLTVGKYASVTTVLYLTVQQKRKTYPSILMNLQHKTALIFIVLLIVLMMLVSIFSSFVILSSYADLEQQYMANDLQLAVTRIDDEANTLSTIVSDWGPWDDTYNFVQGTKPDFIASNLAPETFENIRVNVIIITDRHGKIVYSGAYNLDSKMMMTVPEDLLNQLGLKDPLMNQSDPRKGTHGLILLADYPMIVASRPIVRTDFSGEPQGVVIMGRSLDSREVSRLAQLTRPSLRFFRVDDPALPRDLVRNLQEKKSGDGWTIQPADRNTIDGFTLLKDINGRDALILGISDPRSIYQQGASTTLRFIGIILITGLVFGLVVMFLLDRLVLARLGTLFMQVHDIGSKTRESYRVEIGGGDEFSDLAQEINRMLNTIEDTQQKVKASEARFRELAELLPLIIFEMDSNGNLTYVNKAGVELFGITEQKIAEGINIRIFLSPDNFEKMQTGLSAVMEGVRASGQIYSLKQLDGNLMKALVYVSLIHREGSVIGFRGVVLDISERVRLEEALTESEEYLQSLIWSIRAGIIVIDTKTHTIIDVNPAALEMMGTTKDLIINQRCNKVICSAEVGRCPITDLNQTMDNVESTLLTPDGRQISIIKYIVPVLLHGRQCLLETFIDNSYRKQIEIKLAENEEKYRALTENTVDILFSTNMQGIITYVSPQVNKYGFLVEEVIGKSLSILIHPGDIRRVESTLSRELEKGAQFVSQFRIVDKWGAIYWFEEKSSLRLDISGNPVGIYGILRDITERKRVEDAIDIANKKLNLMNQITRHDILNTITGLLGCVDMAKATNSPEERELFLNDIKDLTRVIQRHITFTREYQEVGVHLPQWQNIDIILHNVLQNFQKSGIIFYVEFENIEIYADPLLEKVFYNLVDNAIRYGVTITTISIYPQISDTGFSLVFEDDGVGVDTGQKLEIFKRGVGKNTGMGLFLTAEILAITGITIEENGIFGKGARFEIRIPNGTWRFPRD